MKKLIFLGVLLTSAVTAFGGDKSSPDELGRLLVRLDRTAETYAERAKSFTCDETISWDRKGKTGRRKFDYVVVLDEDGKFDDYRTRRRKSRSSTAANRVRPADFGVPSYLRSAYLWVFIFKRDRWGFHRYEITGEDVVFDRQAVVIRFEPLPPYEESVNNWFGSAWIDRSNAQILKVVARRPEDHEALEKVEAHRSGEAVSDWVYVAEEITTEFGIEERGIRFPSRVELRQVNYDFMRGLSSFNTKERTVLWVHQKYSDYRFFDVEATEVDEP